MLTFGFATMIFAKENMKVKSVTFLFFYDVENGHFCSRSNSKGDILQKKKKIFFAFIGYPNLKDILLNAPN